MEADERAGLLADDHDDPRPSSVRGAGATLDLDDCIDHIGFGPFQVQVLVICGATQLADAAELLLIAFLTAEVRCEWGLDNFEAALLSTLVFLGMLMGAYTLGVMSDRRGRRFGYLASVSLTAFFGILSAFAPGYWELAVCRFMVGFGVGSGKVFGRWHDGLVKVMRILRARRTHSVWCYKYSRHRPHTHTRCL